MKITDEAVEIVAAETSVADHVRSMLHLMGRGSRVNLTDIPGDTTFLSSNFSGETAKEMAAHIKSAHHHLSQGAVIAKQLEWKVSGLRMFVADTEIGQYAISRDPYSAGGYFNLWLAGADEDTSSEYPSLPEAEAAAQADYERRTLSPALVGVTPLTEFGYGKLVVDTGTFDGNPAVFVGPAVHGGAVGELADPVDQLPKNALKDGEFVLTFPTEDQAQAVADALVGSVAPAPHEPAPADIDKLGAALDTQIDVAERSAKEWRDRATSITTDPQEEPSEAGEVVAWRAPINPYGQPGFTYTSTEAELVRFGHHQREPLVRQSALTACQQEAARAWEQVGFFKEALRQAEADLEGVNQHLPKYAAAVARILELEADLEIANDKLREMVKALASVTHQLRGWQPEEVAVDADLMEDAPAIEHALRVLGGQSNE